VGENLKPHMEDLRKLPRFADHARLPKAHDCPARVILTPASCAILIASWREAFSREVSPEISKKRRETGAIIYVLLKWRKGLMRSDGRFCQN
jgi:hypothetical protein